MTAQANIQNQNLSAQKSNTAISKTKKKFKKNPKTEAAKTALVELSVNLKEQRKELVSTAKNAKEALYLESLGVNELIMIHYKKETGANDVVVKYFRT